MRRGVGKINEERVCIDSLVQHLRGLEEASVITAQEELNDPPDYWLSIGAQRFAVEVTSIVADQGYAALCRVLHTSVKEQCDSSIVGTYALEVFRRPLIPKRGSVQWRALVSHIVSSLKSMSCSSEAGAVALLRDKDGSLTLVKVGEAGRKVGLLSTEAKWEGEMLEELSELLADRVETKRVKIEKKGVLGTCPDVILALYDAYGYADIETAQQALASVQGYDWLHSIYWVAGFSKRQNALYPDSPGRSGTFLYSKNQAWCSHAAPNSGRTHRCAAPPVRPQTYEPTMLSRT
jgi:hypothetical protein